MDSLAQSDLTLTQRGTIRRPLLGLTVLLVEDSRFCAEAVRLLCLRSGARLRRADSRAAAYRHLATYRPSLVLVDIGLPDGSGLDLVRDLAAHRPGAPTLLVVSGDPDLSAEAMAAGADGFLQKPLKNIIDFQDAVRRCFPDRAAGADANIIPIRADVEPDKLAVQEDLRHLCALLGDRGAASDPETLAYCAQFLHSVAHASDDPGLRATADILSDFAARDPVDARALADILADLSARFTRDSVI